MKVDNGWNTDYAKLKFNVELDEGNLRDLLDEHGLPVDIRLTVAQKFFILNNESKSLALTAYSRSGEVRGADAVSVAAQAKQHHQAVITALEKLAKEEANAE